MIDRCSCMHFYAAIDRKDHVILLCLPWQDVIDEKKERDVDQRSDQITKIAKSVTELNSIFKELAVLVIDQGALQRLQVRSCSVVFLFCALRCLHIHFVKNHTILISVVPPSLVGLILAHTPQKKIVGRSSH